MDKSETVLRRVARSLGMFLAAIAVVAVGALAFRLPALDLRPLHGDEANQAYKAGILLETGVYEYDPQEHHGPTLYYLFLPVAWLTGASTFADTTEFTYRIIPVLFGVGLILLLVAVSDGLGRSATVCAAVLAAVSTGLVFYSRYFIQETLLVFFAFAAIASGWRYVRSPKLGWAVAAGVSVGLMHATKETCVLAYAAMAGALVFATAWSRFRDDNGTACREAIQSVNRVHLAAFAFVALVVSVVFFSSFFTHARGPLDSVLTYMNYAHEAGGQGSTAVHDKPWHYYLRLLTYFRYPNSSTWWSEGLIVGLSLVGLVAALAPKASEDRRVHFVRFLAFYTVLLTTAYSVVPYKTPWCLINFLHPMTLLAGFGAVALVRRVRYLPVRIVVCLALVAATWHLGKQAYTANYRLHSDRRNPYVYAHPVPAVRRLDRRAEELAAVHPDGHSMLIHVIAPNGDYWPLPWYLRKFDRVGYWSELPENPDAAMVVVSSDVAGQLEGKLRNAYQAEFAGLRPGVLFQVYIDQVLWDDFLATR